MTASAEGGVGDVQILEERARGGDEQVWEIRGGKEIKRKERKEVRWKGRERKRINRKGKGAGLEKGLLVFRAGTAYTKLFGFRVGAPQCA